MLICNRRFESLGQREKIDSENGQRNKRCQAMILYVRECKGEYQICFAVGIICQCFQEKAAVQGPKIFHDQMEQTSILGIAQVSEHTGHRS